MYKPMVESVRNLAYIYYFKISGFFLKGKLTMLMLPAGNVFDYKITCKSIVMLDNVSEMSL